MLNVCVLSPTTADDDEMAAIMAAIASYELVRAQSQCDSTITAAPESNWKVAARLEGTGRVWRMTTPPVQAVRREGWKYAQLSKLFSLLLPIMLAGAQLGGTSVHAQQWQSPTPYAVTDNRNSVPPLAPPYQTNNGQPPFTDNTVRSAPVTSKLRTTLRVALALNTSVADISLPDGAILKNATTGVILAELPPQSHWQIAVRNPAGSSQICFAGKIDNVAHGQVLIASRNPYRNVAFIPAGARTELVPLPSARPPQFSLPYLENTDGGSRSYVLVPPADGTFAVAGKLYRGNLIVRTKAPAPVSVDPTDIAPARNADALTNPSISLINHVDLEDYLLSVVPSEMPSSWPLEALKAQAVVARSFAIARCGRHETDGYDLKATTEDQVYSGIGAESTNSNRAVAETSGLVLKYAGNVVTAFFHSASGGCTELSENVWSKPLPYLKAVPDYDDESPHFSWTRPFTVADAEQALTKNGRSVGTLLALMPVARGISPRVRWLMAVGSDKTLFISGEMARKVFSLPSSSFNVAPVDGSYLFAGRGFGHGLGMSQWGAKKLAEAGYNVDHILSYYYKDITIERI